MTTNLSGRKHVVSEHFTNVQDRADKKTLFPWDIFTNHGCIMKVFIYQHDIANSDNIIYLFFTVPNKSLICDILLPTIALSQIKQDYCFLLNIKWEVLIGSTHGKCRFYFVHKWGDSSLTEIITGSRCKAHLQMNVWIIYEYTLFIYIKLYRARQ